MEKEFYTSAEAAAIANLPLHAVNRILGSNILRLHRVGGGKKRSRPLLSPWQLIYLRLEAEGVRLFSKALRREVAHALETDPAAEALHVPDCPAMTLHVTSARRHVEKQQEHLQKVKQIIVFDPEIMEGAAHFRGTEIPLEQVASMLAKGAGTDEILARFPALSREQADLASLFIDAYPRLGRPRGAARRPRKNPFTSWRNRPFAHKGAFPRILNPEEGEPPSAKAVLPDGEPQ